MRDEHNNLLVLDRGKGKTTAVVDSIIQEFGRSQYGIILCGHGVETIMRMLLSRMHDHAIEAKVLWRFREIVTYRAIYKFFTGKQDLSAVRGRNDTMFWVDDADGFDDMDDWLAICQGELKLITSSPCGTLEQLERSWGRDR